MTDMDKEEIEEVRKKFKLHDDGVAIDDQPSLLSVGHVRTLLSALDAAREENAALRAELAQKEMSYLGLHKKSQSLFGALKTHCHHLPWCNTQANYFIGGCTCGLAQALSQGAGEEEHGEG